MTRLDRFSAFAAWAKYKIASPRHFAGFVVITALWAVWAASRGFDPFSQLMINSPTTLAEYGFEILILAAAIAAERKGDEVLSHLLAQHARLIEVESHILRLEQAIAAKEGIVDEP